MQPRERLRELGGLVVWFRPVRWPSGQTASWALDRTALLLRSVDVVLVVLCVGLWLLGVRLAFLAAVALLGLFVDVAARWRLRKAVEDAVREGRRSDPVEYRSAFERFMAFLMRRTEQSAAEMESRAKKAAEEDDDKSARKYQEKATRYFHDAASLRERHPFLSDTPHAL